MDVDGMTHNPATPPPDEQGRLPMPTLLIAGVSSGVGKTSVTLALTAALVKRGLRVQTFKVGPDFLDPTYLKIASGRPCYNLDGWMMGRDYIEKLFAEKTVGADIAVIEGVMGLFDGSDVDTMQGSSAEIAAWLGCPVVLVVNAHGMARSIAPLTLGFARFEKETHVTGVIANRCGSQRHGELLKDALEHAGAPKLLGALQREAFPALPSRHLGLVTARKRSLTREILRVFGDTLERYCEVDGIIEAARSAPCRVVGSSAPPVQRKRRVSLGVAYDAAFHFYYADTLEALEAQGCAIERFSPLKDDALPTVDALYFGGGYPEEFAAELAANTALLQSVRDFAAKGKPIYAECGGLMYLCKGLETVAGDFFSMAGVLPAATKMFDKRKTLGYVEVTLTHDTFFGPAGMTLRGHEFHYSGLTEELRGRAGLRSVYALEYRRSHTKVDEGFLMGSTLAGYVHLHLASNPAAVRNFVNSISAGENAS